MQLSARIKQFRMGAVALAAGLAMSGAALAAPGGHAGGFGGGRIGYGGHGGYGWRGGYGYGWHGGYYGGWGWGPWGWGALGLGLYFSTLPYYYSTLWWDGVPYYYAANNYYVWNPSVSSYETVAPPAGLVNQAAGAAGGGQAPAGQELYAYPKNGQSTEQQAKDRYECHRWAADQTGFDPSAAGVSMSPPPAAGSASPGGSAPSAGGAPGPAATASPAKRQDYLRAQAACLEGRGYTAR
jgi:hypothetical protein